MQSPAFSELARKLRSLLPPERPQVGDPPPDKRFRAYTLQRLQRLKMKMCQEKGHALPHIHVDYGSQHHSASFSLDPAKRIEGTLPAREEAIVLAWIAANKEKLIAAWISFQEGAPNRELLAELRGGA